MDPRRGFAALPLLLLTGIAAAQQVAIAPDKENGTYNIGEKVTWNLTASGANSATAKLAYRVKRGGYTTQSEGTVTFQNGKAKIEASSNEAGWILLEVDTTNAEGKPGRALGGALYSPEKIQPAVAAPKDFDSFWASKIAELNQTPFSPLVKADSSNRTDVDYELVTLNGYKNTKIYGQLAKPKKEGKFPALLVVQWAGVYSLQKDWVTGRAGEGWLTFNIQAHELPALESEAFFQQQSAGPLNGYPGIGAESRESSYFLRMYLSCYRAADYLASRPEWNGEVMVVTGGSQGGLQALVTAAIHTKITGAVANVPAGCDQQAQISNRAPGWPSWPWLANNKDKAKVMEAAAYFDVVNFAPKIKCPLLVGVGGIDTVCPPPGIYAALNQVKTIKEIVYMPLADHMGSHNPYYSRTGAWMSALMKKQTPEIP